MDIASGIVLYAILWWMTLFVVMPLNLKTQGEAGEVVPGTPAGAPHAVSIKRKLIVTTVASVFVWIVAVSVIYSGYFDMRMFDVNNILPPAE